MNKFLALAAIVCLSGVDAHKLSKNDEPVPTDKDKVWGHLNDEEVWPVAQTKYIKKQDPSFLQTMDNEADASYQRDRKTAADVVAAQQAFEKAKTADVEKRNDSNSAECSDLRKHVVTTHEERLKQFDPNVQMVYIPEQDVMLYTQ